MPVWRDDKILELANQLTYSPAEKRREQLRLAIHLVPLIETAKTYPWDFVHFRITGFQSRDHIEHSLTGKVLRADLATLIEFLSDTLSIKVEEAEAFAGDDSGEGVLTLEEVSRRFSVSSKTIQRWRKQGLIALKYVYPDGRRKLGFLASAAGAFADANRERVDRSAAFKQMTDEEKSRIISMARQFAAHGHVSIKEVSRQIARHLNRSAETIRYTIRKYERDHPEAAIFTDAEETRRRPITVQTLESLPSAAPAPAPLQPDRISRIKSLKIECIPNPLFEHPQADEIILRVLPTEALTRAQATVSAGTNAKAQDVYMARMPRDLPAFLQDIFRQPVMPHELETDAFRRMNYLKWKAAKRLAALDVTSGDIHALLLDEIESCLDQAHEIHNLLVQSNLRVAVHVARKHQRIDRPLMELVSDATVWLMRTVEKYDFARPARFSTYAGYAIMKNFARDRAEQLTRREKGVLTGQEAILDALGARENAAEPAEQLDAANMQTDLHQVIDELSDRERELLTSHYGLAQDKPALSLAEIGDKMGITKARVRQLEARALRKLRQLLETRRHKLRAATSRPS